MIESIDAKKFGSFKDFIWSNSVLDSNGNIVNFKKCNIIYGRNYSGKTTLSRIFRSLETGKIPEKYANPEFTVTINREKINQTQIPLNNSVIRVYNKDFVDEHLSFLRDNKSDIVAIAISSTENKEVIQEINSIEKELGMIDDGKGMLYKLSDKNTEFKNIEKKRVEEENKLDGMLIKKANKQPNGMKYNKYYNNINYDKRNLRDDIDAVINHSVVVLSFEERKKKEKQLDEKPLPDIKKIQSFNSRFLHFYETSSDLLITKITLSNPITELLNNTLLQNWVKEGISLHKGKRERCSFCGNKIPDDLWRKLDQHFSKESIELENKLNSLIKEIENEREILNSIMTVDKDNFYIASSEKFTMLKKGFISAIEKYNDNLSQIENNLKTRLNNIHATIRLDVYQDYSLEINKSITAINWLIQNNNDKTKSLEDDQEVIRKELRLSEVAQFIQESNYIERKEKIKKLSEKENCLREEIKIIDQTIQEKNKLLIILKNQLKDEKKGADKVNGYLDHYFGHTSLRLKAVEDNDESKQKYIFKIYRNDEPAYNLSEGECSLVSFCYFMAKLSDVETAGENPIIFIDDPVSSLDSNHVFFVYSMIEDMITPIKKDNEGKDVFCYEQLFVSTHNLDFLKYLKRLRKVISSNEHFLTLNSKDRSLIKTMPKYLKKYISEFNFLFEEIVKCTDPAYYDNEWKSYYNFCNNLRKFLEAFLFFKYPTEKRDYEDKLKDYFKNDQISMMLVNRITNEYSHLGEIVDRSTRPIECPEIYKVAQFVLKTMREDDRKQYESLLDSIGEKDIFTD